MWKYVGDGEFLPGVPARDLIEAEVKALSVSIQKAIEESPLYRQEKSRTARQKKGAN